MDRGRVKRAKGREVGAEEAISVYVADDHPVYRKGLVRAFGDDPDLDLVGSASDGGGALRDILRLRPKVAVLDIAMPKMTGLEVHTEAREHGSQTKVILLTGTEQSDIVYGAMAQGICGYLLKTADWLDLLRAVKLIARGGTFVTPEVMNTLAVQIQTRKRSALTRREIDVLKVVADDLTIAQIAEKLVIAPTTVKTHLRNAYTKLGVSGQWAAVNEARRQGLIP